MIDLPTHMDFAGYTVRLLVTLDDYLAAEKAQQEIWNLQDSTWIVESSLLLTAQKNGGLVAGAFDETQRLVGILFGFVGMTREGRFKHCSHLMGIVPAKRRQNVGRALKLFQRQYVRAQGLDLITWTFDPLEGVNATLNIARLGAITGIYYENLYGFLTDGLNAGLPTDRFEVEWYITSPRVAEFVETDRPLPGSGVLLSDGAQKINGTWLDAESVLQPVDLQLDADGPTLLLEIPAEHQAIKAASMKTARAWREHTRTLFGHYFGRGYVVSDFVSERVGGLRRNYYVLTNNRDDVLGA
ncbi:MAG TPA: hypothetical protein VMT34_00660 [Aggregatilineales bacterium]|nr:hypothetical protein [Aggregatilineales bacterium]